jgi:hypothetical protein
MSEQMTPAEAQQALDVAERSRRQVAGEVGLPRGYWWAMAAGWVVLGVIGDEGPVWLASAATLLFGAAHSVLAARLLDGRRRSAEVRPSRSTAGRGTPFVVIGMLLALVAMTVGVGLLLDADGTGHAAIWAGAVTGVVVGLGGPEILATLRRWVRA